MKICKTAHLVLSVLSIGAALTTPLRAQNASPSPAGKPSEAESMAKMMELGQPGESHRLLAQLDGNWDYKLKFSTTPGAELAEAGRGTSVRTALMGGRYFSMNVTGTMLMPGADGQVKDAEFKGMSIDGYDNVKQKFVSSWIDSMGTSIVLAEGTYDATAKSFTYLFEMEPMPGMKTKARQVVTILDANHYKMDWYEPHGGQEVKTLEIDYVRQK